MNVPPDLKYSQTHEWARVEADGTLSVGITDHAQQMLGDIVYVEPPEIGSQFAANAECAAVESVKAAADVYAPVSGEVVAVNVALRDAPQAINQDAYAAWIFRLKPDKPSEFGSLLDAAAYASIVEPAEK
jgi:glycine cleavage system H protein